MNTTTRKTLRRLIVVVGVAIATTLFISSCQPEEEFQAPLFDNLGDYWVQTTTDSKNANRFFVQGLLMSYGFNHAESARSFREAIRLDSTYAMAYWGLAYVLGPNYNLGMSPEDRNEVVWAVANANKYSDGLTAWEKALVKTIEIKFPKDSENADEVAYADAMRDLSETFKENPDILAFVAEAQMNIHAWDLYESKGGEPKPWTPEIVSLLEKAMKIDLEHPLANHLYIHATEASSTPELGNDAAAKLKTLVPGSGHLVHMPSHTYINTGEYHLGSLANEQAVIVDSTYVAQCKAQGAYPQLYYPHNYHFLAACAALEGRGARSIEASLKMADIIDRTYYGEPGYETTQHFITTPYNVMVKFAQWEKILATKAPDQNFPYLTAIWKYSRGMALANTGRLELAKKELSSLVEIQETRELEAIGIFDINTAQDVCDIAVNVLSAEINDKEGNLDAAEALLINAIQIEDALSYNEPPDWFFSVRHLLGDLYIRMEKFTDAERIYKEDLKAFPKNGFALSGLYQSLLKQNKVDLSSEVYIQFTESWKYADSKLKYSRIDESERANLALNIKKDSPEELIYLAGNVCGLK